MSPEEEARLAIKYPVGSAPSCSFKWDGWACTREAGHDGPHAAHVSDTAVGALHGPEDPD